MRTVITAVTLLVASVAYSEEKAPTALFDGNETPLNLIKSDPKKYFGKPFFLVGKIEIDDYYNYAYYEAQDECYSLSFVEAIKSSDGSIIRGERCHLYLNKDDIGKSIVKAILEQEKNKEPFVRVIAGEGRLDRSSPQRAWSMLQLVDVQAFEKGKWQSWIGQPLRDEIEAKQKEADARLKRNREIAESEAARAKADKAARLEKARWRTWTSRDGSKKLEAKFVKCIDDKLTIERKDGTQSIVSLSKFSDDDAAWIKDRGWTK